ncbi:MAG TPA: fibronectin type III domain-containing protein, partial [Solirubrobacteraceae bacterium]|nr:fibronectin type III domain-containing protein [Solirubrobacteraceae bacterium]
NPVPPAATTGTSTDVGQSTATFTGTVNPEGVPATYHFDYGTSTSYGLTTAETSAGTGSSDVAVSVPVSGLTSDTTYHVRLVATNAAGVTRGADVTLRTLAPPRAPSAGTGGARSVTPTGATLTGTVYPHGQATTYHFDYGTSKSYGASTAETGAGASTSGVRVSAAIAGLKPYTKYHYRVVATNATGVARGNDHTFTTLRLPQAVTLSAAPEPSFWSGFTTLTGRVTGQGVGGTTVIVQRQDFPFTAGFRQVATQATKSDGSFLFSIGPLWDATQLRVVTRTTIAVSSPTVTVRNRVLVGLRVQRLSGRRVRLTGAISPAAPRARVSVQRLSARGHWSPVAHGGVAPLARDRSRYALVVQRPRAERRFRVVVLPNDGGAHVRGVSRERVIG